LVGAPFVVMRLPLESTLAALVERTADWPAVKPLIFSPIVVELEVLPR
jgi:hypothetical protein